MIVTMLIAVVAGAALLGLVVVIGTRTALLERTADGASATIRKPARVQRLDRIGLVLAATALVSLAAWVLAAPLRW